MNRRAYSRAAITQRLFNKPLLVLPETASIVLGAVGERFDVSQLFVAAEGRVVPMAELQHAAAAERASISARAFEDQVAPNSAPLAMLPIVGGVAHVEIRGELVSENDGSIGPASGLTGYDGIRAQVLAADAEPAARGILLDINSPGGEVDGLFELCATLMARRGGKPMRAAIRGQGTSAAYAIAACADEITLHTLGVAGSIGVIAMHADFSGRLAREGIKVTLITAGAHKADGNPFEPLPDGVRDRIAALVNTAADQFVAHVAAARGLNEEAIRNQEAAIYHGEEAVAAGLVDKIMGWSDSIQEFRFQVNSSGAGGAGSGGRDQARTARASQEKAMSETSTAPAADKAPEFTQETQAAAVAAAQTAERERIGQLLELDAESKASPVLTAAIAAGTSAGEFAIELQRASNKQRTDALAAARSDAVKGDQLPEQRSDASASTQKPNRGVAAVERMRGKHKGLPAQA